MIWWWLGGGLFAWLYNAHVAKQAALQSIDASMLLVNAASQPLANKVQNATTIQNQYYGAIASDPNVADNYVKMVQALSPSTQASEWLVLATAVQSAGYPLLSNSLSLLGMHLLENGQIGIS